MALSPLHLTVELTELPNWRRSLSVTVPDPIVRAELDRALEQVAARTKVPGFKKGKAPLAVVEKQQGARVRRETLQRVIDEAYRVALEARALQPITEGQLEGVEYEPEAGLVFRIAFEVRPRVVLGRIDGFAVPAPAPDFRPEQVEEALAALREENALWRPAESHARPAPGDLVTVRILRVEPDGRTASATPEEAGLPWAQRLQLRADTEHRGRYQLVIGAGDAEPAVEDAIRTLAPGDTTEVTVPAEGRDGSVERRLRITLEDREIRDLPELDDAFARSLGDFEDLAALRTRLERELREAAADRAEAEVRARLLDQIVAANPFDVPGSMVDGYLASLGGAVPAGVDLRDQAERAVKRLLLLERIAELHGLEATPAEVDARVAEIAARGQVTPEQVRDQLVRTGRLERLVADITNTRVFDFLKGRSKILDGEGEAT